MYIKHFGLDQYPFSLTPNTRYFLKLSTHQLAFQHILQALESNEKFSLVTGEVGTGKTLLCRKTLNALEVHGKLYTTAYIPNPVLSEEGLMIAIADELELTHEEPISYRALLKLLSAAIIHQSKTERRIVLLIDEAQALPEETLAALNLLSSIDEGRNCLQTILFGQPELVDLLAMPSLRNLQNSLNSSYVLAPLDENDVTDYISFRLLKAGYNGKQLFSKKAISLLHKASEGIPRAINVLCHKAMMVAYGSGDLVVDARHIEKAAADSQWQHREKTLTQRLFGA